jgi:excisionase family DNA binding protein
MTSASFNRSTPSPSKHQRAARAIAMEESALTYSQVARLLGLKLGTIYSLVARKQIPHFRIGRRLVRFSRRELDLWLTSRAVLPANDLAPTVSRAPRRSSP